jgi:hypothetical protein
MPAAFQQTEKESLSEWRDRLYQTFRAPSILAALNDIKCAYVEIVNPFLARSVVSQVRRLPDRHRTDKRLFKDIVAYRNPPIVFAESRAIEGHASLLRNPAFLDLISRELSGDQARRVFPAKLLAYLERNVSRSAPAQPAIRPPARRLKAAAKRLLPAGLLAALKSVRGHIQGDTAEIDLDTNRLAFRVYLISRMQTLLGHDANLLNRPGTDTDKGDGVATTGSSSIVS